MKEIDEAIAELMKQHEEALKISYIDKPVVYALYKTWKLFDDKAKKGINNEQRYNQLQSGN